ncbi:hypothetical protein [Novosphingobium sp.]|uniref:hypothetical protein n=1 Tax=Novosphingobium sp. TaxID=1874826 RepID=UPI003B524781
MTSQLWKYDKYIHSGKFHAIISAGGDERKLTLAELRGRELHLVKKALAIAALTIERTPGPFQSASDMTDMKELLDRLIESDVELEHYARAAHISVTGEAPEG